MKIFTQKFKDEISKEIEKFQEFCEKGVSEENGTFEVVASTDTKDRHGEIVDQSGWELKNFLKNPIILFGHNSWDLPIGKATNVSFEDGKMIVKGVFASGEANPKAQQVRKLYDEGILKTVSVGFIVKERDEDNRRKIIKQELLELSFVPIPANPEALDRLKKSGIKTLDLDFIEEKEIDKDIETKENEDKQELSEQIKKMAQDIEVLQKSIEPTEKKDKYEEGTKDFEIKIDAQKINKMSQRLIEKFKPKK